MRLTAGSKLGSHEVLAPLGAGGMGEVYRARDTRLNRDVAIKVLPTAFALDAERLARFEREAQLLAALNHPNIASIHGLEEHAGSRYLVLEYVPGETLAEVVQRGPLPLEDALIICKQIAEALEAAHERGIVHRDLKPANVKITPEGKVKVLDFGLAKDLAVSARVGSDSLSPTLTSPAETRAGIILGTAAYMSPEQARGKPVDKRADIWAFGAVMYELLSGRTAFGGETVSDTMAAILKTEPAIDALPPATPQRVRRLLRRCLQKDSRQRLRDAGDARIEIEDVLAHPAEDVAVAAAAAPHPPRAIPIWVVAAVLVLTLAVAAWALLRPRPADPSTYRLSVTVPPNLVLGDPERPLLDISPDGRVLAVVLGRAEASQLYLRRLDQLAFVPLAGTRGARNPFFSPDGRWIAFTAGRKLQRVSVEGGSPVVITDAEWGAGSWGPDDTLIFTPNYASGLSRVAVAGGSPSVLTTPDTSKGELGHWWPQILPGGKWVLFTNYVTPEPRIVALSLQTGERRTLVERGSFARYVPTGHLLYVHGDSLMAVSFDASRVRTTGAAVSVVNDIPLDVGGNANSQVAYAGNGTFAYIQASTLTANRQVVWVDRKGVAKPALDTPASYFDPRLSPDGKRLAIAIQEGGNQDVWTYDLERASLTRMTFGPGADFAPAWTADGKRLAYISEQRVYTMRWRPADRTGNEEEFGAADYDRFPCSFSPDGKVLAFAEGNPKTDRDIWLLALDGDRKATPLLRTPFAEAMPAFSPDSRWLAYQSNETGRTEVYVQSHPGGGGRVQVSSGGGMEPVWARNGRELFYRNGDKMMAVPVTLQPDLKVGKPALLFEAPYEHFFATPGFDVTPDGQRFVMVRSEPKSGSSQVIVVLNWFDELKRRMAR